MNFKKKLTHLLKGSSSNPDLPVAGGSQLSLPPSGSRSHRGLSKLLHPKSWLKSTNPSAQSAQHSQNPASSSAQDFLPVRISQDPLPLAVPAPKSHHKSWRKSTNPSAPSAQHSQNAASSSAQDILPVRISQDHLPLAVPAPKSDPDQSANSGTAKAELLDPKLKERIADATRGEGDMKNISGVTRNIASSTNHLQSVPSAIDTTSKILDSLRLFSSVADGLANVHPYVQAVLSIFTCASKMILGQADRDAAVNDLLAKISDVYALLTEGGETLARITSKLEICGKIARQTLECADFIVRYSEMKSFWTRLGKNIFNETGAAIQGYNNALDNLMQQFRDQVALRNAATLDRLAEDLDISSMEYVAGAGRNTSKNCLPGTREDILSEIKCWIRSTGEDVPRVLWLSGTAGKGKSAIAHTIANWAHERGGMRACFCFDRTREAENRQERIFTTIARDLARCDLITRGALARVVHDDEELKHTIDISRQWQELVVGPIGEASKAITAPVLMVIDALDESGKAKSRAEIPRVLAGDPNASSPQQCHLPANFRVIVTSRPLEDIADALQPASHVRHISLDEIPLASTQRDIELYISSVLKGRRSAFNVEHFKALAQKSDGMFEWARLACEYIKATNKVGLDPMERFDALMTGTSETGTCLLDEMYRLILADSIPEMERKEALPVFRSVMGQIIASLEPLPMAALATMRQHFSSADGRYKVDRVIGPLSSLLTGTTDSHTPIKPLHASFYDFLTDKLRSHDFFIDASSVQSELAFASLGVMEHGLRFNICSLESSYLSNSAVPDLEKRVKESIPTELSYACRFWGTHATATSFEPSLAKEVKSFFDGERLLWWLEALSLMKSFGGSVGCLLSITDWVTGHAEYTHISDAARDTLRFIRTFASTILHSTPHLYLSALPFAPTQSRIFTKFAAKFPCTPRIVAGHVAKWPQMEKILHGRAAVLSIAMSPDGKRIVCGLEDGTIQVWDMETGEALGAPLQGHTECVSSVAFSSDGTRIVSGSVDHTVRVWDAATGKALGAPLQGHTGWVWSVAISCDGKCIVSCSDDKTVRVWDMETGKALHAPLRGHTHWVISVAISLDGKRIVSGSRDTTIRVWDMGTGEVVGVPLQGHTGSVDSVAISPDGTRIVSGSNDQTIRVWDMETGKASGAPLQGHTSSVQSVVISSNGNRIVSGSYDQTIRVWDVETGAEIGPPLQGHTSSVLSVAISPDGNRIVSGSEDKTIRVWDADISTGGASGTALQGHAASVNSVTISPDGRRIVSGSDDKTVRMWNMRTGEVLGAPLHGHTDFVRSVTISPDGSRIVSGSLDGAVRVWNGETGAASGVPLQGHTNAVQCVAISSDGNHILSGSWDKIIRVSGAETSKVLGAPLEGHDGWVWSVTISLDARYIVSGSDDRTIRVWDMGTGDALHTLRGHTSYVYSVAISPDGHRIVSGSGDTTIRVWDMGTGDALGAPLEGHTDFVRSVIISPDGRLIVSGSNDKMIRVWDMETGKSLGAPLGGHTGVVTSVAISPDGNRIVSGSYDKTIRVWDLEFLNQHSFKAPAVRLSPNPNHALHSASSFLQDSSTTTSLTPNEEGWIVGPDGRLLLCIPLVFHPVMYAPGNTLVIPNDASQFDLSCLVHGTSWHKCREPKVALSS